MTEADPEALKTVGVFSGLDPEERRALMEAAEVTEHAGGETLAEEGALGFRFHMLLDGEALVERGGAQVATIGPGEFVGEIALLGGGRSTATVRCTAPTRCLSIRREDFWDTLEAEPGIALRILEVVCRRLAQELGDPRGNLRPEAS